jgi:propanediol dehydratase small subunit
MSEVKQNMPRPKDKKPEEVKTGIDILDQVLKDETVKKAGGITLDDIAKSPAMRQYQAQVNIAQQKIKWNDEFIRQMEEVGIPEPNVEPQRFKLYQAYKKEKANWEEVIANIRLEIASKLMTTSLLQKNGK